MRELLDSEQANRHAQPADGPITLPERGVLHALAVSAAEHRPTSEAVWWPGGAWTYSELDQWTRRLVTILARLGVGQGDRVGIWLEKSGFAVAATQAVLRMGAVYVPIAPRSPAPRAQAIMRDCDVAVVITAGKRASDCISGVPLVTVDDLNQTGVYDPSVESNDIDPGDLAFILYTSGSTGVPKGVCISHAAAWAFVRWMLDAIHARSGDRYLNHAGLNFDLSVFDLYAAFATASCVHLVPDVLALSAPLLLRLVRQRRIGVVYCVPSAWIGMLDAGLEAAPPPDLHTVLFAGEVFPAKHLRRLRDSLPNALMWNLYGPTETNVCTAYRVDAVGADVPVPIGSASCGNRVWVEDETGRVLATSGSEGELVVDGPTVMRGYWGRPAHEGPYRTGDRVRIETQGSYTFVGRLDDMIKLRGHRVEPGEVESALLMLDGIDDAAVVARGVGDDAHLVAHVVGDRSPELPVIRRHLAERLPHYMNVQRVHRATALPRNANGKLDRRALEPPSPERPAALGRPDP